MAPILSLATSIGVSISASILAGSFGNTSTAIANNYTLSTTYFNTSQFALQPYVSNGYISQRIPLEGFGYKEMIPINASAFDGTSGWPLFDPRFTGAMVAGFYDQQNSTTGTNFAQIGGEEPISMLPTWSSLYFTVNGSTYQVGTNASEIANWTQTMSINDGVVATSLLWTPAKLNSTFNLTYTMFAHRTLPNLGVVRLDVSGLTPGSNVSVTDVLDGIGAWRTTPVASNRTLTNSTNTIYTAVSPNGVPNITAYETSRLVLYPNSTNLTLSPSCYSNLTSNSSTVSQCYTFTARANGSFTAIKYVGIASSDAFPRVEFATALGTSNNASMIGYDRLLASHKSAWQAIWDESDIIFDTEDNPQMEELQLVTRASMFHLLSNVRQGNESTGLGDNSIAPAGLTSDSYAGQIFWDADIWMFPSLLSLFPTYAESITNFRFRQLHQAIENAAFYNRSGGLYAWTSGRTNRCLGVGPCYDYEYHLGNDISIAQYQYYASTHDLTWLNSTGWPVLSNIAEFWASQVIYNSTTGMYITLNETDPDEYANFQNNAAFTNAGISVVLNNAIEIAGILNITVPSNWTDIANNITVLHDPTTGIVLEYEGFNGSVPVKQADVVLLTYPLEYPQTNEQGLENLDFYAIETSPNGPGMTYSVFSIDESQLATVGCASYTYMLASSQPYSRAPFYQFSEQTTDSYATNGGTNPAFTFLTGHGGFLQSLTHGFTGYRSRINAFYIDPVLPPQLSNYTIKGMKWNESTFDVTLTTMNTTITRRNGTKLNCSIEIGPSNPMAGNYSLQVGQSMTIPTRHTNRSLVEGNLAQCANTTSFDTGFSVLTPDIVPGQFRSASIDGSNATSWQPLLNSTSSMVIDLASTATFNRLHFNFGNNPPTLYSVYAGNTTSNMTMISNASVLITAPYNNVTANDVAVKIGNLTDVTLFSNVTARYVNVSISGSFLGDGRGGTISEFAVL